MNPMLSLHIEENGDAGAALEARVDTNGGVIEDLGAKIAFLLDDLNNVQ